VKGAVSLVHCFTVSLLGGSLVQPLAMIKTSLIIDFPEPECLGISLDEQPFYEKFWFNKAQQSPGRHQVLV
jgi:hypothetical protein